MSAIRLPDLLDRVRAAAGMEAAMALAAAFGGVTIWISPEPRAHHKLARAVGDVAAAAIAREIGWGKITVPLARRERALWALAEGWSVARAARFAGMHERQVLRLRRGGAGGQLELFPRPDLCRGAAIAPQVPPSRANNQRW